MTPEGRVKAKINRVIAKFPEIYKFMSVPSGYGPSTLDYLLCAWGTFVAIEAKAPGNKPTPRQESIMEAIRAADGVVFVIDGDTTLLESYLRGLQHEYELKNERHRQSKAQGCWRPDDAGNHQSFPRRAPDRSRRRTAVARTARPNRDVHAAQARVRRASANSHALQLVRRHAV